MSTLQESPRIPRFRAVFEALTVGSPFWDRSWKHRLARLLLRSLGVYGMLLVVLTCLEDWLLFQSSQMNWYGPPPDGKRIQDVWLTSADNTPLHAVWVLPEGWTSRQGALLFCHGNGGNLSYRLECARYWADRHQTAVLLFDYPGYGKSGGTASERGCYAAAEGAYDWLTGEQKVPAERLLLFGGSLGGAVAVELATRRPHRALILFSTFTTFADMAQKQFPFTPARWLVRNRFDSLARMEHLPRPVFVAHGPSDTLVPFAMGQRLFEAAPEPKEFFAMHDHPHDDTGTADAIEACWGFLKDVETQSGVARPHSKTELSDPGAKPDDLASEGILAPARRASERTSAPWHGPSLARQAGVLRQARRGRPGDEAVSAGRGAGRTRRPVASVGLGGVRPVGRLALSLLAGSKRSPQRSQCSSRSSNRHRDRYEA